eukprot:g5420.t1
MTAPTASSSGLDFLLHPLVLINLSDHYTRVHSNANAPNTVVFGCLLGLQSGRVVDISNSFEVICNLSGFDWEFTQTRLEQYKTVFPYLELVGWYTVGDVELDEQHMIIQRKMMEMTESPLLLMLNPVISQLKKDLPVKLYETEVHVIDGVPSFIFVEAKYSIATAEAERIGVEQVAKSAMTSQDRDTGQFLAHLGGIYSAVKMLKDRLTVLYCLMDKMESGEVEMDHGLMREIAGLARRVPFLDTDDFQKSFLKEYNDTLLTVHLAAITKGVNTANEILEKSQYLLERPRKKFAQVM